MQAVVGMFNMVRHMCMRQSDVTSSGLLVNNGDVPPFILNVKYFHSSVYVLY